MASGAEKEEVYTLLLTNITVDSLVKASVMTVVWHNALIQSNAPPLPIQGHRWVFCHFAINHLAYGLGQDPWSKFNVVKSCSEDYYCRRIPIYKYEQAMQTKVVIPDA